MKIMKTLRYGAAMIALVGLLGCEIQNAPAGGKETAASGDTNGTKTIHISVLQSNRFLELAKQKYEEKHPGTVVEIKEYVATPPDMKGKTVLIKGGGGDMDPKDIEKYTTGVTTEMMSGKGPDIISTDYINFQKFAEKKLLANLSELISKDASFQMQDYYTNIFKAAETKGSLYTMPIRVQMNLLVGNQAMLEAAQIQDKSWNWQDFKNSMEKVVKDTNKDGEPDEYAFTSMDGSQLILAMLKSSYQKFIDLGNKKASFTSPEFISFLNLAKSMLNSKLVTPEQKDNSASLFSTRSPMQYEDMILLKQMEYDGHGSFYIPPTENSNKGIAFSSDLALSVNDKSKLKAEAWDFIKFMLSEEMQSALELQGFAVNKKASKSRIEDVKKLTSGNDTGGKKMKFMINGKEFTPQPAKQEDMDRIETYLNSISLFSERNPKVMDILKEETAPFFSGQKSAEEAAKVIQSKISTYLQE